MTELRDGPRVRENGIPMTPRSLWSWAAAAWSVLFAAPHFYWAVGGRGGLGSQAAAADAALGQPWFAAYNLAAGGLGVLGAVLAFMLRQRWGTRSVRRWGLAVAAVASALLVVRGLVGLALLATDFEATVLSGHVPPILLAIEPWFVLGGVTFGLMVREQSSDGLPRPSASATDGWARPTPCQPNLSRRRPPP